MIIASHRLASTWSRPSSTERRRRWWVTERALLKARLESGTEHELVRPSGHGAALAGPGGDRWAAWSGAVPAAIRGSCVRTGTGTAIELQLSIGSTVVYC